jgi:GAF domain-containing protein
VARTGAPLHIGQDIPADLARLIIEEDRTGEFFASPGILSAPLYINSRVVGVVNVSGRTDGRFFGEAEAEYLTTLAGHAAIALTNAGNYYRLKKSAV